MLGHGLHPSAGTAVATFKYLERGGAVTEAGTFRLDLDDLADRGVVNRRSTPSGLGSTPRSCRRGGRSALQVRDGTSRERCGARAVAPRVKGGLPDPHENTEDTRGPLHLAPKI